MLGLFFSDLRDDKCSYGADLTPDGASYASDVGFFISLALSSIKLTWCCLELAVAHKLNAFLKFTLD